MNKLDQWWNKISLPVKLAGVLLPSVAIGTIVLMIILNSSSLHASFLNKDSDVTGWGSLLIGSAIGIYITFAILFYSDASQKKIDSIIEQQEKYRKSRYDFEADALRFYLDILYDHWVFLESHASKESPVTEEIQASINSKYHVMGNLNQEIQRSIGVIEPEIIENIDEICYYAEQSPEIVEIDGIKKLKKDNSNNFPAVSSFIEAVFKKLPETKHLFPPK